MKSRIFITTISALSLSLTVQAQQTHDSTEVRLSAETFVTAFNTFQWEPFRKSFTEDATIFFPDWEEAPRRTGKVEIEKAWLEIFPEFKDPGNTGKLNITPREIKIQLYDQTAIVTFHLGNGEKHLARRTLVMVKTKEGWKIAHLHASVLFPPATK